MTHGQTTSHILSPLLMYIIYASARRRRPDQPLSTYTDFDLACSRLKGWCGPASSCNPDRNVLAGRCNKWGTECCVARKTVCVLWNSGFCTGRLKDCSTGNFVVSGFLCSPTKICCVEKTASFKIPPPFVDMSISHGH